MKGYPETASFIRSNARFMGTFAKLALKNIRIPYTTNVIERLMGEISKRCKHKWMHRSTKGLDNILQIILVRYTNPQFYEQYFSGSSRPDLGRVDAATRFYLLWRWTFGNRKVHFDDARKITQSVGGIELTEMWDDSGLVKKEKEFVTVLGPKDRMFTGKEKPDTMVDALHRAVALWEKGNRSKLQEMLAEAGYLRNEVFWQVAQAISDVLPERDRKKQSLQGFLYGKDAVHQTREPGFVVIVTEGVCCYRKCSDGLRQHVGGDVPLARPPGNICGDRPDASNTRNTYSSYS